MTFLPQRLAWQCRRGMLELDLLLQGFLERGYSRLDAASQAQFEALLAYPDPVLLEYLMGRAVPADPALARVVAAVRAAVS
ncbi:MAG TPA: succinate dehydrogenase assembly factor 2 [Gammaproteobacteria bacterium]|nr:succinate dehydrogenase assembly factor 2 [Gammaproteobacteria bacterium]